MNLTVRVLTRLYQGAEQSQKAVDYGVWYRTMFAEMIKTGKSTVAPNFKENNGQWSRIDMHEPVLSNTVPFAQACVVFDTANLYGMF